MVLDAPSDWPPCNISEGTSPRDQRTDVGTRTADSAAVAERGRRFLGSCPFPLLRSRGRGSCPCPRSHAARDDTNNRTLSQGHPLSLEGTVQLASAYSLPVPRGGLRVPRGAHPGNGYGKALRKASKMAQRRRAAPEREPSTLICATHLGEFLSHPCALCGVVLTGKWKWEMEVGKIGELFQYFRRPLGTGLRKYF